MKSDPRIDAYIDRQAEFARPILAHLRAAIHAACPDCEETLKWGAPAFIYRGQILAGMAAFKAHAAFNFWRGSLVLEEAPERPSAMGQFGRIAAIADLPDAAALDALIRKAMALTDAGIKPVRDKSVRAAIPVPDDLRAALGDNPAAKTHFDAFSPSAQRDYAEWIVTAKQPATRAARIAQAVEWIADGKKRNWKYEQC